MMTLCGKEIHRAIATAAGVGILIAVPRMTGFMIIEAHARNLSFGSIGYVNVPAALAITSSSVFTAPWGVTVAHTLDANALRIVFGQNLLFTSYMMFCTGSIDG